MKVFTSIFLYLLLSSVSAAQDTIEDCGTETLIDYKEYSRLTCIAKVEYFSSNFDDALEAIDKAANMVLFEVPNVEFYPLRALIKHKSGDQMGALKDLNKAKLSILVNAGLVDCTDGPAFDLVGKNTVLDQFSENEKNEISSRMCGAIYEGYYQGTDFNFIKHNYKLIKEYERIENIIIKNKELN